MKIALVHDDLVQWGGAERVLVAISDMFPDAPIYTSVYDRDNKILAQNFKNKKIITSFIQKIPQWKKIYKILLPLYPIAFEQFDFTGFDLVISQTTRFAKSIITKPGTKHVCYCHTPPRFLWDFSGQKITGLLQPYLSLLRVYDHISSNRVDFWIAGSENAQKRLKKIYGVNSQIVYPFVDLERFKGIEPFDGGYFLVVSRLNSYKRVDLAVLAANRLGIPLKIVGVGPQKKRLENMAGDTVEFLDSADEKILTQIISGCKGLIVACEEDFGLSALEAQALGKPVVAFKKGGALENVIDGETGQFFASQTVESLSESLVVLDKRGYNKNRCREQARRFSKENFEKQFKNQVFHYEL